MKGVFAGIHSLLQKGDWLRPGCLSPFCNEPRTRSQSQGLTPPRSQKRHDGLHTTHPVPPIATHRSRACGFLVDIHRSSHNIRAQPFTARREGYRHIFQVQLESTVHRRESAFLYCGKMSQSPACERITFGRNEIGQKRGSGRLRRGLKSRGRALSQVPVPMISTRQC